MKSKKEESWEIVKWQSLRCEVVAEERELMAALQETNMQVANI